MLFNRRASGMVAYRRWMSRVDSMVQRSGGNWNKLSPKEKTYLVDIIGKGDEKAAMQTFQDRADLKKTTTH